MSDAVFWLALILWPLIGVTLAAHGHLHSLGSVAKDLATDRAIPVLVVPARPPARRR